MELIRLHGLQERQTQLSIRHVKSKMCASCTLCSVFRLDTQFHLWSAFHAAAARLLPISPSVGQRELSCLLKEIAEGTYKTKHAEAARLDYTTTQRHIDTNMNKDRPASTPKLGHLVKRHCAPTCA